MINKQATKKIQGEELFVKENRNYSDIELQDFHKKIQKFWDEPRPVEDGLAQKFRFDDLAVAFGAMKKVPGSFGKYHYVAFSERYEELLNVWKQYESFRRKKDWVEEKRSEEMVKTAESMGF